MTKIDDKNEITRRAFFERTAGALATAGILAADLDATNVGTASGSPCMKGDCRLNAPSVGDRNGQSKQHLRLSPGVARRERVAEVILNF